MSFSIQTNSTSLIAQTALGQSKTRMDTAMERLATGLRINSAADDAAGLQIADRLNSSVIGMKAANRNVSDGVSMMQTADGALAELTSIADRQKELATQAANGVNNADDKMALTKEYASLNKEAARILDTTKFAGQNLFGTTGVLAKGVTLQIGDGADKNNQLTVKLPASMTDAVKALAVPEATTAVVGKAAVIDKTSGKVTTAAVAAVNVGDPTSTLTAADITKVDDLMKTIDQARSSLGENINRLHHTSANLTSMVEKTTTAKGHIMDADFATETSIMTKNQLLQQSGIKVLGRSNQAPSMVLGLLG